MGTYIIVTPHRYAQETIGRIDAGEIPGDYKLINHGKAISGSINKSSLITLRTDGSVVGASTGTWQLRGDHFARLDLNGSTYRGVFVRVWDDDQKSWVKAFSAISTAGVAVWGSHVVR